MFKLKLIVIHGVDADVAVGDWSVIALEHQGTDGVFGAGDAARGLFRHFQVFVKHLAVELDVQEFGVGVLDFLVFI